MVPARPPIPGRPFIYPDWSTLARAFEGESCAADDARRLLRELVLRVAREANLCISLTHVWELLHRDDPASRIGMARWLDAIPLVWLLPMREVIRAEVRRALLDAICGRRTPPSIPVAPSFLRVFDGWDPVGEALSNALRNPTVTALVEEIGGNAGSMRQLVEFRRLSIDYARRYYVDRGLAMRERDEGALRAELDARLRAQLEIDAVQAAGELRRDPTSGIHVARNGVIVPPTDEEVRAACGGFPDLAVAPYVFLVDRVTRNMSFEVVRRPNVRVRAFDRQQGDFYDSEHLVGAAYCDVFTCDQKVAQRLDGGRELLGKAPPITAQGGVPALHRRIVEQLAAFGL